MTHFQIDYCNEGIILKTEHRSHETNVAPSEKMVKNALHTICLNAGAKDFSRAFALVYRDNILYKTIKP